MPVSLESALNIGEALPSVERTTSWGQPTLKVRGQMMACVPTHKSAEPGSLVIRVDRGAREGMLAEQPELYYIKEHYTGYDAVLVRLDRATPELMRDLMAMAHRYVSKKKQRG
jgi:hypothetical protein